MRGCFTLELNSASFVLQPVAQVASRCDRPEMFAALKTWAKGLKRDVVALWIAARDPRVSWYAKALAGAFAAYALSPIDLIPDFVPVLGYVDDLLIFPAGIWLVVRLIPPPLMAEFREEAARRLQRPTSYNAAAVIALIWVAMAVGVVWLLLRQV